ncbi:hypothetical protein P5673_032404 [Acropora cervicornis]|uniref:Uncharacterized protein n=1 Tax=Acropora cervicornis TaxID=6130 RepID=A0AAD9PR85_ACRCE|nr:hypothetical protein P5673_032404 [Acropora cervicornis]
METKIALHLYKKFVFFIIALALLRETDRCMDILSFALFIFINSFAPSLSTTVVENCATPTCICSYDPIYNTTATCHTNDLKNDLRRFIKRPMFIGAV